MLHNVNSLNNIAKSVIWQILTYADNGNVQISKVKFWFRRSILIGSSIFAL